MQGNVRSALLGAGVQPGRKPAPAALVRPAAAYQSKIGCKGSKPSTMGGATTQGEDAMARVALDLENKDDLKVIKAAGWRIAPGLVPGEPNQGLVAERRGSPARLADYDDSGWALGDIQERRSVGFTFAWYRLRFTMIHPGGTVPSHRLTPHAHPARTTACVHPQSGDVVRWQCPSGKNPGL